MKRVAAALASLAVIGSAAEDGRACTMVPRLLAPDPWAVVGAADAAFVGTLVDERRTGVQTSEPVVLTFEVERWLKGGPSARVEVRTAASSASCGLGLAMGQRVGLVATSSQGRLSAGLGDQYDPAFLARGARPLPRPTGSGPGRLLAGGAFGDSRLALLDEKGRALRYGKGQGVVASLSPCPGGRHALELVNRHGTVFLGVRRLATFALVREIRLAGDAGGTVACLDAAGADALATISVSVPTTNSSGTQLVRVTSIGTRVLERAERLEFAVRGARVAVSFHSGRLVLRDLNAGTRRSLMSTRDLLTGLSLSPDGRYLAGSTDRLTVVDLGRRSSRSRAGITGSTDWVGRDRILVGAGSFFGAGGRIQLVDRTLRPLRPATPWRSEVTAMGDGRVFGIQPPRTVVTVSASGSVATLAPIFSTGVTTFAVLPSP